MAPAPFAQTNADDIEPEKPSLNNSNTEIVDEDSEKEKTGSLKDYFVGYCYQP